jgi:hypothetical protein
MTSPLWVNDTFLSVIVPQLRSPVSMQLDTMANNASAIIVFFILWFGLN